MNQAEPLYEQVLCLICSRLTVNSIIFVKYLAYTSCSWHHYVTCSLTILISTTARTNFYDEECDTHPFHWAQCKYLSRVACGVAVNCFDRWSCRQTFDNTSFLLNMFSYIDVYVAVRMSSRLCLSCIYTKWSKGTDKKFWAHRWLRDALWRSASKQK